VGDKVCSTILDFFFENGRLDGDANHTHINCFDF
jgi:hypothetical protein